MRRSRRNSVWASTLGLSILWGFWISGAEATEFLVTNDCIDEVRLAVRYRDAASGTWQTRAWYIIKAGDTQYLSSRGKRLRTDSSVFYIFARTEDKKTVWKGNTNDEKDRTYMVVDGRKLRFLRRQDAKGNRDLRLTCSSRLPNPKSPLLPPCLDISGHCCPDLKADRYLRRFDKCLLP